MIRWTARLENAMDTSKLIEQLSKMFRISLNRGKPWITLEAELTYSQSYLALQKRRLGKSWNSRCIAKPELWKLRCLNS